MFGAKHYTRIDVHTCFRISHTTPENLKYDGGSKRFLTALGFAKSDSQTELIKAKSQLCNTVASAIFAHLLLFVESNIKNSQHKYHICNVWWLLTRFNEAYNQVLAVDCNSPPPLPLPTLLILLQATTAFYELTNDSPLLNPLEIKFWAAELQNEHWSDQSSVNRREEHPPL